MTISPRVVGFFLLSISSALAGDIPKPPAKVPADGLVWEIGPEMKIEELLPAKIVKLSATKLDDGTPAIQMEHPPTDGYHGLNFPVPAEGWDFTGFDGLQVDVTNPSADTPVNVFLEIGGLKREEGKRPQILASNSIQPGETSTIEISFDSTIGRSEGEFDRSDVRSIRVNGSPSGQPVTLLVSALKAYKN